MEDILAEAAGTLTSPRENDDPFRGRKPLRWNFWCAARPESLSWGRYNISNHLGAAFALFPLGVTADQAGPRGVA